MSKRVLCTCNEIKPINHAVNIYKNINNDCFFFSSMWMPGCTKGGHRSQGEGRVDVEMAHPHVATLYHRALPHVATTVHPATMQCSVFTHFAGVHCNNISLFGTWYTLTQCTVYNHFNISTRLNTTGLYMTPCKTPHCVVRKWGGGIHDMIQSNIY